MTSVVADTHAVIWFLADPLTPTRCAKPRRMDSGVSEIPSPQPHDVLGLPLISRDRKITASSIQTIW